MRHSRGLAAPEFVGDCRLYPRCEIVKISYKTADEIAKMREAGKVASAILDEICEAAKPGVSTYELDQIGRRLIEKHRVKSAFLGYAPGGAPPYPGVICASPNSVVVHGIPSKRCVLKTGDILSVDFGIFKDGFCADTARTVAVGEISEQRRRLVEVTKASLAAAISACLVGSRTGDWGHAVQTVVETAGFSVVRAFVGHGIGKSMHEDPQIPNFGTPGKGPELRPGMTLAIEPMISQGTWKVDVMTNGWTVKTRDRKRSAHFEHTVLVVESGPAEILTCVERK